MSEYRNCKVMIECHSTLICGPFCFFLLLIVRKTKLSGVPRNLQFAHVTTSLHSWSNKTRNRKSHAISAPNIHITIQQLYHEKSIYFSNMRTIFLKGRVTI